MKTGKTAIVKNGFTQPSNVSLIIMMGVMIHAVSSPIPILQSLFIFDLKTSEMAAPEVAMLPFLSSSPMNKGRATKADKGKTVAERIQWMSRTSDVLGSFTETTSDSSITLIRRKIQERCGSTQELMSTIRRLKSGESGHVTPNEFRLTLIKFGISIPQNLVDSTFKLFDSDGSGTIDFDEFAMWIMNSEFRPVAKSKSVVKVTPQQKLQAALARSMQAHPEVFASMKKNINFMELVSDTSRKNMELTERDCREIFRHLDPTETGVLQTAKLKRFALQGLTDTPPVSARAYVKPDIKESVYNVVGNSTNLLANCFSFVQPGAKMDFEEFRRCLLSNGVGIVTKDVQDLFFSLGGKSGFADIDLLFRVINYKPPHLTAMGSQGKTDQPNFIAASRSERKVREAVRKCHAQLRHTFELVDHSKDGHVTPDLMRKILNGLALQLNFQDFRLVMQNIPTNSAGNYDYHVFLKHFDPIKAPHELSLTRKNVPGLASYSETGYSGMQHSQSLPGSRGHSGGDFSNSLGDSASTSALGASRTSSATADKVNAELKRMWQGAVKACKARDATRTGFVPREVFVEALSQHLSQTLDSAAVEELANSYGIGDDVDYHSCFRATLNNVMGAAGSSSTSKSKFELAVTSKSRDLRPNHPWDFEYQKTVNKKEEGDPYWKRACTIPRERGLGSSRLASSAMNNSTEASTCDPKILAAAKKAVGNPQFKRFANELKRASLTSHKECVSVKNFLAILKMFDIELEQREVGSILRVFRTRGMADTVTFADFLAVCDTM